MKSVPEISRGIRDLSERAMQNKLTVSDLTGGTFTVTNLGGYGVDLFAPVINPPQCAILGFGRTAEKPIIVENAGASSIHHDTFIGIRSQDRGRRSGSTVPATSQGTTGRSEDARLISSHAVAKA